VLGSKIPESLQRIVQEIRKTEVKLKEMESTNSLDSNGVDITAEGASTLADSLLGEDPVLMAIRRKQCKQAARRLYSKHHPDKGGDKDYFNLIKRAADSLDLEFLHLELYRQTGVEDAELQSLEHRLDVRTQLLKGSQLYKVVASYISADPDFETKLEVLLKCRLIYLNQRIMTWKPKTT
jgi:hypothetical protein